MAASHISPYSSLFLYVIIATILISIKKNSFWRPNLSTEYDYLGCLLMILIAIIHLFVLACIGYIGIKLNCLKQNGKNKLLSIRN